MNTETGHPKVPLWIAPLVLAGLVAAFGVWGNARLRQTIQRQLAAELTATLDANVTALEIWTTNQIKLATVLAGEPSLRASALPILVHADGEASDRSAFAELMRDRLKGTGYQIADLVGTNLMIVANSMRDGRGRSRPVFDDQVAKYTELFATGQPVLITPFKPKRPGGGGPPPGNGPRGMGFPSGRGDRSGPPRGSRRDDAPPGPDGDGPPPQEPPRFRRGDLTLMQVAAPLRDAAGTLRGALALVIDPDAEFSRILSVARSGGSGETYAFDQHGLMISRSRFDDQLKALGLITNRPGASSALNVRLSDPGRDFPVAIAPEELATAMRPLTRIVAAAVAGSSGVDVSASRDYRGVPVVGAWRWLPKLGFGVATQIDATEAYQSLRVLKGVFIILVLLLMLSATGMFVFSFANLRWRRRLGEAELKLRQLGQYTLEEKIGEGGMGVVYRGRHALMRRDTAVKLLLPDRASPEAIARFEREVRLTCQLTHPCTIQVFDYGHTPDGVFYYVMEYLRGLNLHDLVARFGPQPEERVVHILAQVCESLAEAHALGLVHRDIKPANVFLCERGGQADCVKVLDFGLVREFRLPRSEQAQRTELTTVMGTPSFMSPESIKDAALSDPRADLYAVGALGYFLLTGENVFEAGTFLELYERHLTHAPVPPNQRGPNPVSAELEAVLMRCLAKDPKDRPQTAGELRAQLLASPRAGEWTEERRADWWARYVGPMPSTTSPVLPSSRPVDATVKIDFAQRTPPGR